MLAPRLKGVGAVNRGIVQHHETELPRAPKGRGLIRFGEGIKGGDHRCGSDGVLGGVEEQLIAASQKAQHLQAGATMAGDAVG